MNLLEESGVYFIQAESGGPVKIGRSIDPDKRMKALHVRKSCLAHLAKSADEKGGRDG